MVIYHCICGSSIYVDNYFYCSGFLLECRKPKTKVLTQVKHKEQRPSSEPMRTTNTGSQDKAREHFYERVLIGFGFSSDWMKTVASFLSQSMSVEMQTQRKCELLSTLKEKPLRLYTFRPRWSRRPHKAQSVISTVPF